MDIELISKRIQEIEEAMLQADFWNDKNQAQSLIKELKDLQNARDGVGAFDKGPAIVTILAGAGGDDAEDFVRMLAEMYTKYADQSGISYTLLSDTPNTLGGYRNISYEFQGKSSYQKLNNE